MYRGLKAFDDAAAYSHGDDDVEDQVNTLLSALDLVGTFVFAIAGATAGVRRQLDIFGVAVLSFATACSGGIARDVLLAQVPIVLRSDLYAVAALAGAAVVAIGIQLGLAPAVTVTAGALLCFALRMFAIRRDWQLPRAGAAGDDAKNRRD